MTDYDSIYHRLFGQAGLVAALLREFVPEVGLDEFDLDGITRENAKFHALTGKRREGDTAWRIPRRGGGAAYVLVLLEFQSSIDRWMALRVLVYVGLLWQHLLNEDRLPPDGQLPPILPIVLYNGETRWAAPLSLHELVGLPESSPLWPWQPNAKYYIIDEGRYGEADLARRDGLLPLLFRLESAADAGHLMVVTEALSAWFEANPAQRKLRGLFVEVLRGAVASLMRETTLPQNLLEAKTVLAERVKAWRREAERVGEERGEQRGMEIGEQRGEQRGERRGEQRGKQMGEAALLLRLLERRFGALPAWVAERLAGAETGTLEEWGLRLLEAGSLDEVFS